LQDQRRWEKKSQSSSGLSSKKIWGKKTKVHAERRLIENVVHNFLNGGKGKMDQGGRQNQKWLMHSRHSQKDRLVKLNRRFQTWSRHLWVGKKKKISRQRLRDAIRGGGAKKEGRPSPNMRGRNPKGRGGERAKAEVEREETEKQTSQRNQKKAGISSARTWQKAEQNTSR